MLSPITRVYKISLKDFFCWVMPQEVQGSKVCAEAGSSV